ncbi:uncharacterized protein A4U43_C05F23980 [Asparagus officinalis]|uniref:Auxin efflux carrier component n=1 Tax=Asparagus officinalis TaxID=4686 RepID=A0A5P1EVE5_ASPOF|nr:uncharacterized protein A4U43_C05F23980 [Asparagus officinalis]
MLTGRDFYEVLSALVPLYVAMILAYGSVRWWKIFTPDQCAGINRFVAVFAIPLLSFHFISANNPYAMNFRFIAADALQKVVILVILLLWNFTKFGNLDWLITFFSLSTLPNTLVIGIPLLTAMYGDFSASLMVQIVVLQSVIWYTILLFLFEYRGARALISEQFPPDVVKSIASVEVESDVVSLSSREPLQADMETMKDGKLRVLIKRSYSSSRSLASHGLISQNSIALRDFDYGEMEIFSLSSRETSPRALNFKKASFYPMSSRKVTGLRAEYDYNLNENKEIRFEKLKGVRTRNLDSISSYPIPNPTLSELDMDSINRTGANDGLHMFVWSTSSRTVPEEDLRDDVRTAYINSSDDEFSKTGSHQKTGGLRGTDISSNHANPKRKTGRDVELCAEDELKRKNSKLPVTESRLIAIDKAGEDEEGEQVNVSSAMPPATVVTKLIIIMVWRKLIRNPNTYGSIIGLVWSLISFRWNVGLPKIIYGSITILSNTGLGLAMFSLGLFMALQPKIVTCGKKVALFSMAVKFLVGPIVITVTSVAIGLRGDLLRVSILQASLPQGIVPFVFAKEYACHAGILSTAVIFGMFLSLPVTIIYYILLGLKV